jgi:hypothetical protein
MGEGHPSDEEIAAISCMSEILLRDPAVTPSFVSVASFCL